MVDGFVKKLLTATAVGFVAIAVVVALLWNHHGPAFDKKVSEKYGTTIERQSSLLGSVGMYRIEGKLWECSKVPGDQPGLNCTGLGEPTRKNLRDAGVLPEKKKKNIEKDKPSKKKDKKSKKKSQKV